MNRLEKVKEALEFIANGCLVPPDGGSPNLSDAADSAQEALAELKEFMGGEADYLHAIAWLCALWTRSNEVRNEALSDKEKAHETIMMQFPIVQGLRNQMVLKDIGKFELDKDKAKDGILEAQAAINVIKEEK